MTKRIYANAAEKQRAYRERLSARETAPKPLKLTQPKRQSRPKRLAAIEEAVRGLADEYQQWHDSIPENLASSTLADDLQQVITELEAIADAVSAIDPPRVGR